MLKRINSRIPNECAICVKEFKENIYDTVTSLHCNSMHVFHCNCILEWFKEEPICPLCRSPITINGTIEHNK